MSLDIFKNFIDWYTSKSVNAKNIVLIGLITSFFGYNYFNYVKAEKKETEELRNEVVELRIEVSELQRQLFEYKTNNILLKATSDYFPIATWLTDLKGNVIWANNAYEQKYLIPNGFTLKDLIGTNGNHVFGAENASKAIENNDLVLKFNRPITFGEEERTTKFPVKLGGYVYAVGGIEYTEFKK